MYVRMLTGGRKGEVQEVKFHIAKELIAQKRAEKVEFETNVSEMATLQKANKTAVIHSAGGAAGLDAGQPGGKSKETPVSPRKKGKK